MLKYEKTYLGPLESSATACFVDGFPFFFLGAVGLVFSFCDWSEGGAGTADNFGAGGGMPLDVVGA